MLSLFWLVGSSWCSSIPHTRLWAQAPAKVTDLEEDEDDELRRTPGLIATYTVPNGQVAEFTRVEALPAYHLFSGEVPDPRITAFGWTVRWQGVIEVRSPGKYRLGAITSGPATITVAGQKLLELTQASSERAQGPEVELEFGLHPLEIEFTHTAVAPRFQAYWVGETFAWEPIPPHVLGHRTAPPATTISLEQGWLQLEEHSCVACHRPAQGTLAQSLQTRPGPHLTNVGARTNAAYIYHWLGNPQELRPGAVMPQMFAANKQGDLERHAVALFLASLGKSEIPNRKLSPDQQKQWPGLGEVLFQQTGCLVCHAAQGKTPARAVLQQLGQKTTPEHLAQFLLNPTATDPSGRMPAFQLKPDEAHQLALYLTQRDAKVAEPLKLPQLPELSEVQAALLGQRISEATVLELATQPLADQMIRLGRRIVQTRRCANCHELKIPGEEQLWQPVPAESPFATIATLKRGGCLSETPQNAGQTPHFATNLDRTSVTQALSVLRDLPAAKAPGHSAQLTLQRLNCIGCHERNAQGGLAPELVAKLTLNQTEQNAESVSPPPLTGVSQRLLAGYFTDVLEQGRRARPWMALRMPQFIKGHVTGLGHGLASLEGEPQATEAFRPTPNPELAAAGRALLGEKGFSCFKCHDLLDVTAQGTRAPELSLASERINFVWFDRWLRDPQRLQPGTRMPTIFPNGKSQYEDILQGNPEQQRLAIWHYLLASKSLPYPEGLKSRTPEVARATTKPLLVRTFLPGTTPRGMAVQFPNQVHLAFDAQACRLAYSWTGEFLDMSPVWNGRGGQRAGIKGATFWTAPEGFPWTVTSSASEIPDYTQRGTDTSLGAELPHDGQLHPVKLHFTGYKTSAVGPEFRYRLDLDNERLAEFTEHVETLAAPSGPGLRREVSVKVPRGQFVWLQVGIPESPPQWLSKTNEQGELKDGETESAAKALLIRQGGQVYYLFLKEPDPGAVWLTQQQGNQRRLLLRLPSVGEKGGVSVSLHLWKPVQPSLEDLQTRWTTPQP